MIVIAGVAIVLYTIGSQLRGTPIRAKRLIIVPGIIAVVGVVNLASRSVLRTGEDIGLIAVGSAVAAVTGLSLGWLMRLERRDGWLWGQLPRRGLWLWAAFFASRGVLVGIARAVGAHVAAATHAELLILGINRLAQAFVVGGRASHGSPPLGGLFTATDPATNAAPQAGAEFREPTARDDRVPPPPAGRLSDLLEQSGGRGSRLTSRPARRQARRDRRRPR